MFAYVSPPKQSAHGRGLSSCPQGTCVLNFDQCMNNCMQVRKQQLELDMEQQTGSKQEKEYVKAVYHHPTYLTYMQSIF